MPVKAPGRPQFSAGNFRLCNISAIRNSKALERE